MSAQGEKANSKGTFGPKGEEKRSVNKTLSQTVNFQILPAHLPQNFCNQPSMIPIFHYSTIPNSNL